MKVRNIVFPLVLSVVLAVVLFILGEITAGIIAISFSFLMVLTTLTIIFYDLRQKKKQDKRFGILTKENFIIEYNKLIKMKENDKLKAVCLLVIKPYGKYTDSDIKSFSTYLKKKFSIDPIGYDDGIVIALANIHELMLEEMMKQIKEELMSKKIPISFRFGIEYYTGNETYEELMLHIKKGMK